MLVAVVVIAGGFAGRLIYGWVEHPRTVVALIGEPSCPDVKPGDVFQIWAYPYGKVLGSASDVRVDPRNPTRGAAVFHVNKDTPDFQIVDVTGTEYSGSHSYAEVAAEASPFEISVCEDTSMRLTPLGP